MIGDPYLSNPDAAVTPRPWVKWAYEPYRAEDVPAALSTSTLPQHQEWLPAVEPDSDYATPAGGIGWALPASVGIALGDRDRGDTRPVIGLIGDGSFQYSIQSLWTAAQHHLPFGCDAVDVSTTGELKAEFIKALNSGVDRPTVIVVRTQPEHASL